jgi:hypothetical protein
VGKSSQINRAYLCNFQELQKVKIRPIDENSPNLVTVLPHQGMRCKILQRYRCCNSRSYVVLGPES